MHLQLKNIGQITDADIHFGDLTVFVGPQATGKSVTLQFLKLVLDMGQIQDEMKHYGIDWAGRLPDFFDVFFGEGMQHLWKDELSEVHWDNKTLLLPQLIGRKRERQDGNCLLHTRPESTGSTRRMASAVLRTAQGLSFCRS